MQKCYERAIWPRWILTRLLDVYEVLKNEITLNSPDKKSPGNGFTHGQIALEINSTENNVKFKKAAWLKESCLQWKLFPKPAFKEK